MINQGYQPNKGKLDPKNPPKGGSGLTNDKDYIELKNIKRVKLDKEDIIVLSTEKNLHPEYADKIKKHFGKDFPDNKVLILTGGLKLSILKPYKKDEDISPLKAVSFIK